jgi:hypothetical protein
MVEQSEAGAGEGDGVLRAGRGDAAAGLSSSWPAAPTSCQALSASSILMSEGCPCTTRTGQLPAVTDVAQAVACCGFIPYRSRIRGPPQLDEADGDVQADGVHIQ